jgi:hypothetical protein
MSHDFKLPVPLPSFYKNYVEENKNLERILKYKNKHKLMNLQNYSNTFSKEKNRNKIYSHHVFKNTQVIDTQGSLYSREDLKTEVEERIEMLLNTEPCEERTICRNTNKALNNNNNNYNSNESKFKINPRNYIKDYMTRGIFTNGNVTPDDNLYGTIGNKFSK